VTENETSTEQQVHITSAVGRVNGARWLMAIVTMTSGATHVVTDNSETVADEIREAQQEVQP